jgi:peptidoglycan-N-acetylglucosamine deacetylase
LSNIKRNIIEIPWPYFQFIFKFPTGGGPVLRLLGARYILRGLKESLQRGNTLFYFHPIDTSEENFPLNISFIQKLFWAIKGDTVTRRIKTILEEINSHIITCSELVQQNG